ncbi:ImmA/IrrE family metallo-endopeptidase [Planobispora rosea]|uniref:ImmA/IrrE family metallo-endopeptidase n=1 Tax=Planobispora rosea TaxID=35762 RepID=UPI00083A4567|nr:ImmA/IrrE family metallo-endopeptidase [Planobispora rosea]
MPYTKLTPEERRERAQAAHAELTGALESLMTADGWQAMIQAGAWMRRYTLANLMMIIRQCPDATDVRPLREWNKAGRRVRKGEHGIRIWAPRMKRAEEEETSGNGENSDPAQRMLAGFLLVSVFDVAQTEGAPLAEPADAPRPERLTGEAAPGLWEALAVQVRALGFAVERGDCGLAMGRTEFAARTVRVRPDVDPAQAVKTLAHELAHILCDHENRDVPRELMEVEAESVACVVAAACGMSTLAYSVPYVAGWAGDLETVKDSAKRVLAVANRILTDLDLPAQQAA